MNETEQELRDMVSRLELELAQLRRRFGLEVFGPQICLKEASYLTGFHQETVRQWCEAGKVESHRRGGQWSVSRDSLLSFVGARDGLRKRCA